MTEIVQLIKLSLICPQSTSTSTVNDVSVFVLSYSCPSFSINSYCKIVLLYRASRIDTSFHCIIGWNLIYCHKLCILLSFMLVCFYGAVPVFSVFLCYTCFYLSVLYCMLWAFRCVKWWWWWRWILPSTQCQKLSENHQSNLATVHVLSEFSQVWTTDSESVVLRFVMKPATGCPFCLSVGATEMSHQPICRSYITSTYSVIVSGTFADECGISKYVHKLIINRRRNGINKRRKPNESLTKMSYTILHVKCNTAIHTHTQHGDCLYVDRQQYMYIHKKLSYRNETVRLLHYI